MHSNKSVILLIVLSFVEHSVTHEQQNKVELEGDIIIAGLFPMHESNVSRNADYEYRENYWPCGAIKEEKGIQRLEAMLYAIDKINSDLSLLPNIKLGARIFDTCTNPTHAVDQSMEFIRSSICYPGCDQGTSLPLHNKIHHAPVVGVIGAASSDVSVKVAEMLRLVKVPQISYASSSDQLSDKKKFSFFSRVVPPDKFQAQAMVDIVKALGFDHVSTVADKGEYGEEGIEAFKEKSKIEHICISWSVEIKDTSTSDDYRRFISELLVENKTTAVVMFVKEDNIRKLLAAARETNQSSSFIWIASDAWGTKVYPVKNQEQTAEQAITILPQTVVIKEFDEYFQLLRPDVNQCKQHNVNVRINQREMNCRNPWFAHYWEQRYRCSLSDKRNRCPRTQHITGHVQEGLVPFVVDAVYAMSHAIHNLLKDRCSMKLSGCSALYCGGTMLSYIRNVSFIGQQNHLVQFDKHGDIAGNYNLYQYQKKANKYKYVQIGTWNRNLSLNLSLTSWKLNNISIPNQPCSHPCNVGSIRNRYNNCCWNCIRCSLNATVTKNKCEACPEGKMPNKNRTACEDIPLKYISWSSWWAIVPLVFSVLGFLCAAFALSVFLRYRNTPVIMASSRELSYLILCGVLLLYLMPLIILAKPSIATCTIERIVVSLSLCLCYSAILTKTNRIFRLFNKNIKSIHVPRFVSPRSQIMICLGICSVQLFISIFWLMVQPSKVSQECPRWDMCVLSCGFAHTRVISSMSYNMLLIAICTVYAFKTRRIPENFNEAKFISFTMYSTCIVWLAFIGVYLQTTGDYKMKLSCECVVICICASVILGCLFVPKLYIVLFQPHKNTRRSSKVKNSSIASSNTPKFSSQISSQSTQPVTSMH